MGTSIAAVITAAGSSTRMGGIKKEYLVLPEIPDTVGTAREPDGEALTVLGAAVSVFASVDRIGPIIITVPPNADNGEYAARRALPQRLLRQEVPAIFFVPGGASRRVSVHHALSTLAGFKPDYVLIHDGARPWIRPELVDRVIDAVIRYDAVLPAMPPSETPKELEGGFVKRHLNRASVVMAQTPQAFAFKPLLAAHEKAAQRELAESVEYTDDAQIWGEFVGPVAVIGGDKDNRKITFPYDILL
ncbi:MAG: 2-C-methyl-D-erythritol 4-phosphate cytidylyltransferase [Spirochaetaceae bacterium]|jgi:2-C-methyl-D-erythritol 4-phosphate cytidylyltransferase/2-C-methyl-D-erythritol 4-phosphate cytidylyltransferase/2-C-methyl-D-erythritol 2,4-cyclodiphosphate synthase|nr:2-C-methyl-D-erythritol 4-phosphate cytidylyltransferase [Spirochaetaceae bacterium]